MPAKVTAKQLKSLGLRTADIKYLSKVKKLVFEKPCSIESRIKGNSSVGYLTYIGQHGDIRDTDIGRFCSIGPNVFCGLTEHPTDWFSTHVFQYSKNIVFEDYEEYSKLRGSTKFRPKKRKNIIGNDVWIGEGSFISLGVTIGDGAVIAARSVVTKDVPPYTIVAGVPAKPIRKRFDDETIARFQKLEWWKYDISPHVKKLDYTKATKTLDVLEKLAAEGKLQPLKPAAHILKMGLKERELELEKL